MSRPSPKLRRSRSLPPNYEQLNVNQHRTYGSTSVSPVNHLRTQSYESYRIANPPRYPQIANAQNPYQSTYISLAPILFRRATGETHAGDVAGMGAQTPSPRSASPSDIITKLRDKLDHVGVILESRGAHVAVLWLTTVDVVAVLTEILTSLWTDQQKCRDGTELNAQTGIVKGSWRAVETAMYILHWISLSILLLFVLEILLRILVARPSPLHFFSSLYHILDTLVIVTSLVLQIVLVPGSKGEELASLIIIFRFWRVIRLIESVTMLESARTSERLSVLHLHAEALDRHLTQCRTRIHVLKNMLNEVGVEVPHGWEEDPREEEICGEYRPEDTMGSHMASGEHCGSRPRMTPCTQNPYDQSRSYRRVSSSDTYLAPANSLSPFHSVADSVSYLSFGSEPSTAGTEDPDLNSLECEADTYHRAGMTKAAGDVLVPAAPRYDL
ncbi:Voltage-gated hydrogen channel 1 [Gonapodya sp. JEL0774]|nr:Voltage-gated hydrogen channel 1 [Gonapodya sp. JEL0774]